VDFYDTLTADQQAAFRTALFEGIDPAACQGVAMPALATADLLANADTRSSAVDCYQQAHGMPNGGTLDAPTYRAIMGVSSTGEKVAIALILAAVAWSFTRKGRR
jgi:hypothetical protein